MRRRTRQVILLLLSLPALAFILLPLFSLFLRAETARFRTDVCCEGVSTALHLSLVTSGVSALLIVLMGTPLAYWLTFGHFRGKRLVDSIVDLPIVLPPAVAGVALLMAFGYFGLIGRYLNEAGLSISTGTSVAVVIAQTFVACPFYIRQARIGFQNVPTQLILASRTLGASHTRTLLRVVFPLAWHALVAGLIMSWARALGEFGATIIFAGNTQGITQTMPLAIYFQLTGGVSGQNGLQAAIALSIVLVVISFIVMVATKLLLTTGDRKTADNRLAAV